MAIVIFIAILTSIVQCIDLNGLYQQNTTLTSDTEYYVTSDVIIEQDVIFQIPNNVNITFSGNYKLTVKGKLIIGCQYINTDDIDNIVGLVNNNLYTLINAEIDETLEIYQLQIYIAQTASASICNAKFKNMYHALYLQSYCCVTCF